MKHLNTYQEIDKVSEIMGATPWQTIHILLKKLNDNLVASITAIEQNNLALKCKKLSNANDITMYLQDCLNIQVDPQLCQKLDGMYQHLQKLIFQGNARNAVEKLNEAQIIVDNISIWWDQVKP